MAVDRVPKAVIKIIDIKCPASGEGHTVCWDNVALAQAHDDGSSDEFLERAKAALSTAADLVAAHAAPS